MSDKWITYGNRMYYPTDILERQISYYRTLFESYKINMDEVALEIGAGHGINTEIFLNIFNKYIAIEPSESLFEKLEVFISEKYSNRNINILLLLMVVKK
jgi:16S rRNA A1518/A1519 N6-dimethyltransferase RsmA/KsgA/DIM1 with predicted DNA glycosylase/AP lyase activity